MAKGKKVKEIDFKGPAMGMVKGGATLGLGSQMVGSVGGSTAAHGQAGMTAAAKYMPAMGTAMGGGMVLQQAQKLQKHTKRKKR